MTEAELYVAMRQLAQREMKAFRDAEMVDGAAHPNCRKGGRPSTGKTLEDFERAAAMGLSAIEAAKHLGVGTAAVQHYVRNYGVKFRDGRKKA
jgi:hypothetical protein